MKGLFAALLLCPLLVIARETPVEKPAFKVNKWEIGMNTGMAISSQKGMAFYDDAFFVGRSNLSLYRNFSSSQIGGRVEIGYSPLDESWFLAPEVLVNKILNLKLLRVYGGGSVGYKRLDPGNLPSSFNVNASSGYTVGLQGGVVYHLGKHISVNAEASAKSEQMWSHYKGSDIAEYTRNNSYFNLYFPMSIGVRYRF